MGDLKGCLVTDSELAEHVRGAGERRRTFNFTTDVFEKVAEKLQTKAALWFVWDDGSERQFSYLELLQLSSKVAKVLQSVCGVKQGDVVMVSLPRTPEWWICVLAINRIGAVYVPSSVMSTEYEKQYQVQYSEASAIICSHTVVDIINKIYPACPKLKQRVVVRTGKNYLDMLDTVSYEKSGDWIDLHEELGKADSISGDATEGRVGVDEKSSMFFTSGTTSRQKLTVHTAGFMYLHSLESIKETLDYGVKDVFWQLTDLSWIKAVLTYYAGPFALGVTLFCKEMQVLNFESCLEPLEKYPITKFCAPPTAYRHMVKHPNLSSFKCSTLTGCHSGGENLDIEVGRKWRHTFHTPIRDLYGQTELGLVVSTKANEYRESSMGTAVEQFRGGKLVILADDMKTELGCGEEGVLACRVRPTRPGTLFMEYKNDAAATAATFHGDYYITGDRAIKDGDGFYYHRGRADDIINTYLGYRIGPAEIENVLIVHPDIVEAAVVSSPDEEKREAIKAFVVARHNRTTDSAFCEEIKEAVRHRLGETRVPHKIEFVDKLPKTSSGKVMRSVLRKQEWSDLKK